MICLSEKFCLVFECHHLKTEFMCFIAVECISLYPVKKCIYFYFLVRDDLKHCLCDTTAYTSVNNDFVILMITAIKSQLMDYKRKDIFILPITDLCVPCSIPCRGTPVYFR